MQNPKPPKMKKLLLPAVVITATMLLLSCSKGITTYEAANGKAKCGRHIK
jgi:hypothetical protein